ncbi:MAG: hypothetical protein IH820_10155, partial [Bacteroidetes bacterium]|nr:hypothetical protein [Bacteroidota bacterium]
IRGGEPSQNLVQIDGVLLYQPFHILGFYSAFPSDLLSRTDIYAGGFGSKYGERISSVIDIAARSGNKQRFAGAATLSPFISSVRVEGPLVKDRLSLLASVRQSLVEDAAARLIDQRLPFSFGDVFVTLHGVVSETSRASALVIQTHDRGTLVEDTGGTPPEEVRWGNQVAGVRFLVLPRLFSLSADLRVSYSRLETELGPSDEPRRTSAIENAHVAIDGTFFGDKADIDVGIGLRILKQQSRLSGLYQNIEARDERLEYASAYVEPEFKLGAGWRLRSGLRVQFFDGFALIDDITAAVRVPGSRRVIYERPFNARLPTYHRLDVSAERTFPLGNADLTVQGSIINLYDRRNLFYLDVFTLRRVDQLPLIPSFGIKVEFRWHVGPARYHHRRRFTFWILDFGGGISRFRNPKSPIPHPKDEHSRMPETDPGYRHPGENC